MPGQPKPNRRAVSTHHGGRRDRDSPTRTRQEGKPEPMSRFTKKRTLMLVSATVLLTAGIAVAYFTTTGSGTGTGSVGTSSAMTLHGTVAGTLYPGVSSTVNLTVDNPSSSHQP